MLCQRGAALSHLIGNEVGIGDVFLFFGLFREVELINGRWCFRKQTKAKHCIWGWMEVGEVLNPTQDPIPEWLQYHPHIINPSGSDRIFIASQAQAFLQLKDRFVLSNPDSHRVTDWCLPDWFFPKNRTPLSYHSRMDRWQKAGRACLLRSAARGQEFILNTSEYPESNAWLNHFIKAES